MASSHGHFVSYHRYIIGALFGHEIRCRVFKLQPSPKRELILPTLRDCTGRPQPEFYISTFRAVTTDSCSSSILGSSAFSRSEIGRTFLIPRRLGAGPRWIATQAAEARPAPFSRSVREELWQPSWAASPTGPPALVALTRLA